MRSRLLRAVGAVTAAYGFAEAFSQRRILLDAATRDRLNAAITSIRRTLTTQLFPALTDLDGGIPETRRQDVAALVSALAADINDVRTVLEHATLPTPNPA